MSVSLSLSFSLFLASRGIRRPSDTTTTTAIRNGINNDGIEVVIIMIIIIEEAVSKKILRSLERICWCWGGRGRGKSTKERAAIVCVCLCVGSWWMKAALLYSTERKWPCFFPFWTTSYDFYCCWIELSGVNKEQRTKNKEQRKR